MSTHHNGATWVQAFLADWVEGAYTATLTSAEGAVCLDWLNVR